MYRGCSSETTIFSFVVSIAGLVAYSGRREGWTFIPPYFILDINVDGIKSPNDTATIRLRLWRGAGNVQFLKVSIW